MKNIINNPMTKIYAAYTAAGIFGACGIYAWVKVFTVVTMGC